MFVLCQDSSHTRKCKCLNLTPSVYDGYGVKKQFPIFVIVNKLQLYAISYCVNASSRKCKHTLYDVACPVPNKKDFGSVLLISIRRLYSCGTKILHLQPWTCGRVTPCCCCHHCSVRALSDSRCVVFQWCAAHYQLPHVFLSNGLCHTTYHPAPF